MAVRIRSQGITAKQVAGLLPARDPSLHKGGAGRVLIAAGSPGMAGAAVLAAGAALRGGAGLVYVGADEALWPIIQASEPCAVCVGRPGIKTGGEAASATQAPPEAPEARDPYFGAYDAVAIGPGLGTGPDAEYVVARAFADYGGPLILDADALNIIVGGGHADRSLLSRLLPLLPGSIGGLPRAVITPHPGEAARLLGVSASDIQSDRPGAAERLAEKYGVVAVLKGRATLVAVPRRKDGPGRELFENTTGNPGMATGGSGDALTGLIASFAAQGMNLRDAAIAGVFIHGLAGDLASDERGEYGLIAADIVDALPAAIMRVGERDHIRL
ncbi:MAG: NAD(P)H-hydrate dehydratase [Clostridiales Family XIII bacterium]|nr:NAD(P)H-hydrate dehydratase [Clostridiales Family XIII bacterium]